MPKSVTISSTQTGFPDYLDFRLLREQGIKHIGQLSGKIWTDHNIHDPGITMLEVLCFALTDLGFRNNLDFADLIALDKNKGEEETNFFTAAEILSCNPLTPLDYRKLLIDINGVRNAWLVPVDESLVDKHPEVRMYYNPATNKLEERAAPGSEPVLLNGLYKVYLELEHLPVPKPNSGKDEEDLLSPESILAKAREVLHRHRNLCEDFHDVSILGDDRIGICADLELTPDADPDEVLTDLYLNVQEFLSPTLRFYTLEEMMEKGKTVEEIFEGRPLTRESHGFIDPADLDKMDLRSELHASDIYREILKDRRIRAIKKLLLFNFKDGSCSGSEGQEWILPLTKGRRPVLYPDCSNITFFKGPIPLTGNRTQAKERFEKRLSNFEKSPLEPAQLDLLIPEGQLRDLSAYYSIQHEFPLTYGIGPGGLSSGVSSKRKAQARQLQAYLLFYDQLLANYLSQLNNIRRLFSNKPSGDSDARTYFSQGLTNNPNMGELMHFFKKANNGQVQYSWETHDSGDVLARSALGFPSPELRDEAIRKTIAALQSQRIMLDTRWMEKEDPNDEEGYAFVASNHHGDELIIGAGKYASEEDALKQAEILFILLIQTDSFRPNNYRRKKNDELVAEYAFELVYRSSDYLTYLHTISESPEGFQERRNRFLDHLLGRFSEQFTDYVLLVYALDRQKPSPEKVIQDKENFLQNYPQISRNRGQAYDYTDMAVWDSGNISGLERRVAALMGIHNQHRKTLSPIQVSERDIQFQFELKDNSGNLWFRSFKTYPSTTAAENEYKALRTAVINGDETIYRIDLNDSFPDTIMGFSVYIYQDGQEKAFLGPHPQTYRTEQERNEKLADFIGLIKDNQLTISYSDLKGGLYLSVHDSTGKAIMEGTRLFPNEEEVWEEVNRILRLRHAGQVHFYRFIDHMQDGRYAFQLVDSRFSVARYPFNLHSAEERENAVEDLLEYINSHAPASLFTEVVVETAHYNYSGNGFWKYQIKNKNNASEVWWESAEEFGENKEALDKGLAEYVTVLALGRESSFYRFVEDQGNAGYQRIRLVDAFGKVMAVHPNRFLEARIKEKATELRGKARLFPIEVSDQGYGFQLFRPAPGPASWEEEGFWEERLLWKSYHAYASISKAWRAFNGADEAATAEIDHAVMASGQAPGLSSFLTLAREKENYLQTGEENMGPFSLELIDQDYVLATHPGVYASLTQREEALRKVENQMNIEGFHVVEHLLLRPSKSPNYQLAFLFNYVFQGEKKSFHLFSIRSYPQPPDLSERTAFQEELETAFSLAVDGADNFSDWWESMKDEDEAVNITLEEIFTKPNGTPIANGERTLDEEKEAVFERLFRELYKHNGGADKGQVIIIPPERNWPDDADDTIDPLFEAFNLCPPDPECIEPGQLPDSDPLFENYLPQVDPFSFWASIIIPYWPSRFQDRNFREFFENTLRRETPAHIALRISWIDPEQMSSFESRYRAWLEAMSRGNAAQLPMLRNNLTNAILETQNQYPESSIQDQANPSIENTAVLDFTKLA